MHRTTLEGQPIDTPGVAAPADEGQDGPLLVPDPEPGERGADERSLYFPGPKDQEREDLPRLDYEPVTDTDEDGGKVRGVGSIPLGGPD